MCYKKTIVSEIPIKIRGSRITANMGGMVVNLDAQSYNNYVAAVGDSATIISYAQ